MKKEKKICIDDSQTTRLLTDTWKMAKGDNTDICPTVHEMVIEHVPAEIRLGKKSKTKKAKDSIDKASEYINSRVTKKAKTWLDGLF